MVLRTPCKKSKSKDRKGEELEEIIKLMSNKKKLVWVKTGERSKQDHQSLGRAIFHMGKTNIHENKPTTRLPTPNGSEFE